MSKWYFSYSHRGHAAPILGAPALAAQNLTVRHPLGLMPALNEVNLNVPVGARMALVGPNGAGKSTLLKAIAGLLPLQAGQIRVYGQPIGACHHRVAYLSQRSEVDWRFPLNVRQLALTGRYVHLGWLRRPASKDYALVEQVLSQLHLSELAGRQIGQLSGGQQQRALLARALVQEADLLLLDEPLNAVDTKTRDIVMEVLKMLQTQGKTALVATHDLGRLAADFDGAIYLEEGRLMTPRPEVAQVAR